MLRGQMESNKIQSNHNLFSPGPKENSELAGGDVTQEKFFLSRGKQQRNCDCSSDRWRGCPWLYPSVAPKRP